MKKRTRNTILIAAAALAGGMLLGRLIFGGTPVAPAGDHPHAPAGEETVWTCSMHPQIRSSEPGACPICGMDLIPLAGPIPDTLDPEAIRLSPAAMKLAQVQTMTVGKMDPEKVVRLNGKVQADERRISSQVSHFPGRIESLEVAFTGDFVRKGQVIARVYSPELVTAQEELLEAMKIAETHPGLAAAAKEKLRNWKLSDQEIERVIQDGKPQESFPVRSDASGFVMRKIVNNGDYVRTGQSIYELADLSRVWVLFDVYEADIPWVKEGDAVEFTVASLPGQQFKGKVAYIDPSIDPRTRVAKARLEIANPDGRLKPEMFASGVLYAKARVKSDAIAVPRSAVLWTGKRSVVYVRLDGKTGDDFVMREIVTGLSVGDYYLVESGLAEGEEVVVNGVFSIDAAAQLAGKPSMMQPAGGRPGASGHRHSGGEQAPAGETDPLLTTPAKAALKPAFRYYWDWKEALVRDDPQGAQKAAENMRKALLDVDKAVFPAPALSEFMEFARAAGLVLQHAGHWKGLDEIRSGFEQVSNALIGFAETSAPFDTVVYRQHCPMANQNKGADWLSRDSAIENPYFGASMLNCGEVIRQFK